MPPYQWLIGRGVERTKDLMREKGRLLTGVALSAGFAELSHYSRVFQSHRHAAKRLATGRVRRAGAAAHLHWPTHEGINVRMCRRNLATD